MCRHFVLSFRPGMGFPRYRKSEALDKIHLARRGHLQLGESPQYSLAGQIPAVHVRRDQEPRRSIHQNAPHLGGLAGCGRLEFPHAHIGYRHCEQHYATMLRPLAKSSLALTYYCHGCGLYCLHYAVVNFEISVFENSGFSRVLRGRVLSAQCSVRAALVRCC